MGSLINYDLDKKHKEVKESMYKLGFQNYFIHRKFENGKYTDVTVYLPNTTLYHPIKDEVTAFNDLERVAAVFQARREHCISTAFDPQTSGWKALLGDKW